MNLITIEELYEQHIRPMSTVEKLRLVSMITQQLVAEPAMVEDVEKPKHSIMELHGLGAEIWQGVDAQEYINQLREEWNHRP
jgi:hypothetical protein